MNLAQAKMKQMYLEAQAKLCKSYSKEMTAETGKLRVLAVKFSPSEDVVNPVYFFELPTADDEAAEQAATPAAGQTAAQADKCEAKIKEG